MPARVFVALLTSDAGRLTAAEIGAALQASPAAVSGAVRYLVQIGLVARASEPGTRRLAYSVPEDVWQHMIEARNAEMARWARILREGADLLSDSPAGARVAETAEYFDFVVGELPGVQARWEQYRARQAEMTGGQDRGARSAGQNLCLPLSVGKTNKQHRRLES